MKRYLIPIFLSVLFTVQAVIAGWPCNPNQSIAVSTNAGMQWNQQLTSDGKFGAYVVWQDRRGGPTDKLYLQHIGATGNMFWAEGGIPVSNTSGFQYYPQVIQDGSGGVIVVWEDNRNGIDYDVYAQRFSADGVPLWISGGVTVCAINGNQFYPKVVQDGAGGVIIAWQDRRSGNYDVYAQRLNSGGGTYWQANGVPVVVLSGSQQNPELVSDGNGGALIAWVDFRAGGTSDIYAQRILPDSGALAWGGTGVGLCVAGNSQLNVRVASDGSQGMIASWQDRRTGGVDQLFAQRIDVNGIVMWTTDGVALAPSSGVQTFPQISSDGLNGAVVAWQDNRSGIDYDIYSQRVDGNGNMLWGGNGTAVCASPNDQLNPQLYGDAGSAILSWQDKRDSINVYDIFIQKINTIGIPQWGNNGTAVFTATSDQFSPQMTSDGAHGAIITWADFRLGGGFPDIFAHRFGANGQSAGGCYRTFSQDSLAAKGVRIYVNRFQPMKVPNAGNVRDTVFARGAFPGGMTIGIARKDSAFIYGWMLFKRSMNIKNALPETSASHPFDMILKRKFRGQALNPNYRTIKNSIVGELIALKMSIAASDVGITQRGFGDLIFNDASMPANPMNNRSLRKIAAYVDSTLTLWKWYLGSSINYSQLASTLREITTAFDGPIDTVRTKPLTIKSSRSLGDVAFLLSSPQIEFELPAFTADASAGIEEDIPAKYMLQQNYPNPFNPYTTISFEVPEAAFVTLKVFNVLGQEVATILDHIAVDQGSQQVVFDGSTLSSGVYFYKLYAENLTDGISFSTKTQKMVLLK